MMMLISYKKTNSSLLHCKQTRRGALAQPQELQAPATAVMPEHSKSAVYFNQLAKSYPKDFDENFSRRYRSRAPELTPAPQQPPSSFGCSLQP